MHTGYVPYTARTSTFTTRKTVPITGRANSFFEINMFLKSNLNQIHSFFLLFFLPVSRANLSSVVDTIFSSLAFLSSSVSMANLSRLVATSFSSFALLSSSVSTTKLSCLLATTYTSLRLLSNSFSSHRFNLLRVTWRCFSWSSVCDDFFFSSCIFFCSICSIFFASYPQPFSPLFSSL